MASISFKDIYNTISESNTRIFYTLKKAVFMLCLITVLSYFFPTTHNGDIIDIIWSNLYWAAPSLALLNFFLLIILAYRETKNQRSHPFV